MRKIKKLFMKNKSEPETIRDAAVKSLYDVVTDYTIWYPEHGLYLPPNFATDPTGWTVALQKMARAMELLYDEMNQEGELWKAKNEWAGVSNEPDSQKIEELHKEIEEGFILLGQNLLYLTDPKKGVESAH